MADNDQLAQQLHCKASLGIALSADEKVHLDSWYARLDQEERAMLSRARTTQSAAALQAQIDATIGRIGEVTKSIQEQTAMNEALRQENAALQRQLTQRATAQPA